MDQDRFNRVCALIADGLSLRKASRIENIDKSTFLRWVAESEQLRDQYARAVKERWEESADEIVDIADDLTEDARSRAVRIDARKWCAARMLPKKYGDKVQNEITGADGGALEHNIQVVFVAKPSNG